MVVLSVSIGTAAFNVAVGMLTVFMVLILISLIIYCFRIFPYLEEKKAKRQAGKGLFEKKSHGSVDDDDEDEQVFVQSGSVIGSAGPYRAPSDLQDERIVAVIAAAIAAGTGVNTDSFVVRSIRRRK